MHAALASSAAHCRRSNSKDGTLKLAEMYHRQQALCMFQEIISALAVEDMDAVLSTSMVLTIVAFATDEFDPSKSWVFSPDPWRSIAWLRQQ